MERQEGGGRFGTERGDVKMPLRIEWAERKVEEEDLDTMKEVE